MKIITVIIVMVFCMSSAFAQSTVKKKDITIKGKIQFLNPDPYTRFNKVWIYKRNGGDKNMIDSTLIAPNGEWQLKLKNVIPSLYEIDIASWDRANIFSDANLTINTRGYDTAKIKIKNPPYVFVDGSDANSFIDLVDHVVYMNYQTMIASGQEMYYAGKSKDTSWSAYLKSKDPYQSLNNDFVSRIKVLIQAHKDKPEVIYALSMINWERNQDIIMPILANLNKKYPWFKDASELQKNMEDKIAQAKLLKPGMPVPSVSYPNEKGIVKGFDQFKGKILLIDFWASWCGPCRQAVPKVKELYTKYNGEGLEVVSISIDDSKSAWQKAMTEEKMPWQQWLSPDKNETMKKFLFSGIPTLYLIDREGKIIGSYTGFGENVEKNVAQQFSKQKN